MFGQSEQAPQLAAGLGLLARRDIERRACRHDPPALVAATGTEIDDVVGVGDELEVVLDHDQRVALG